ncbi:MAG: winged helix-turn-helix transcriptional regulator [Chloroflexi bacterium]|nr:winged helix-turn-helix transcriptional regulator [Chloroflexota bacterium]
MSDWKFLTNHALVLSWITQHPQSTAREIAIAIGITERTALKIVGELADTGYIDRRRKGRRNVYRVHPDIPLRHHIGRNVLIGDLLAVIAPKRRRGAA